MKTIFISRLKNPDLANFFDLKRLHINERAVFTQVDPGPFHWPLIERNSLRSIISPRQTVLAWRLSRSIRRSGIGRVVFDNADPANVYVGIFLKGSGIQLAYTIHDQIPHGGNRVVRAYNWLVNNVLADDVIIFSPLQMRTRARVRQFRLGGYQGEGADVRTGREESAPRIALLFGRIESYKGYEYLPELARRLAADGVKIVVAGRGNSDALEAAREIEGVEIVNRFIPDNEACAMFNSARVNLLPYKEATQSGVLLHAASFGVPSVAFAVGGIEEYMLPQIGCCIAPGDVDAMAEAALRYLQMSTEDWAKVQRKCREAYFAHYGEASYVAQYRKLTDEDQK